MLKNRLSAIREVRNPLGCSPLLIVTLALVILVSHTKVTSRKAHRAYKMQNTHYTMFAKYIRQDHFHTYSTSGQNWLKSKMTEDPSSFDSPHAATRVA